MEPRTKLADPAPHDGAADLTCLASREVLDRIATGVIFLSAARRVVALNAEAERIVTADDGLGVDRDCRLCATGPDAPRFGRVMGLASSGALPRGSYASGALQLRRDAGSSYGILVCPLPRSSEISTDGPVVAVLVSDPECRPESTALLMKLYGLTRAEARLTKAIASGRTPAEAASALGVTLNTVRWTLKQVFAKTGTRRQAELARLVLGGPATILAEAAEPRSSPASPPARGLSSARR